MYCTVKTLVAVAVLAAQASAKTITIDVGKDGLAFTPDSVTAAKGDILEYHFYEVHSVAMGDFANGCTPSSKGGFFSGVVKVEGSTASKEVFQVAVNNTDPMAFYCTVGRHCQNGMVGVVNPSSTDSLDKYKAAAKTAQQNKAPSDVFGGKMVNSTATSSSSGAPTSSSQASSTSSAASAAKTGAAPYLQKSLAGMGAAAAGLAAFLV